MTRVRFPKPVRLPHDAYGNPEAVFHVVIRAAIDRAPFGDAAVGSAVWTLVEGERTRPSVVVLVACLMPDHLHLLVKPADRDIIAWVDSFKSYSTRVAWGHQRGILWQPGFYDRRLRNDAEFEAARRYVMENPAAAGLAGDGQPWPWAPDWVEQQAGERGRGV